MEEHGGVAEELQNETGEEKMAEAARQEAERELAEVQAGTAPKAAEEDHSEHASPLKGVPKPADQPGIGRPAEPPEVEAGVPLSSSKIVTREHRKAVRRQRLAA